MKAKTNFNLKYACSIYFLNLKDVGYKTEINY